MSKGWESKNIENQQAEAASARVPQDPALASAIRNDADRTRRIQSLELQRERILSERTASPHRRSALVLALETIERDLVALGSAIKL